MGSSSWADADAAAVQQPSESEQLELQLPLQLGNGNGDGNGDGPGRATGRQHACGKALPLTAVAGVGERARSLVTGVERGGTDGGRDLGKSDQGRRRRRTRTRTRRSRGGGRGRGGAWDGVTNPIG